MYFLKKLFEKYFENNEPTEPKSTTDDKNDDSKHFSESSNQLNTVKNDCEKKIGCSDVKI